MHHTQAAALLTCEAVYLVRKKSGTLKFPVRITDVREAWGVINCRIKPRDGAGEAWVKLESLYNLDPQDRTEYEYQAAIDKLREITSEDHIAGR